MRRSPVPVWTRPRVIVLLLSCLCAAIWGGTIYARQGATGGTQAAFRAETDLISVDVSVLDGNRRAVRGLTAADFTVLEDGKPRPVAAFSAVEVPAAERATPAATNGPAPAAWLRDAPHDLVSNTLPAEGRLVVILFDRSIPAGQSVRVAQQVGVRAIDELGPGDLAAVTRSSGFSNEGRVQGFTSDRKLLLDAVQSHFKGMTVLDMPNDSPERRNNPVPGVSDSTTDCHCGLCVFETIGNIANAMADAPRRRKVILLVGSAITIEVMDARDPCFGILKEPRERMLRDLDMANVTVHTIDPVGLFTTSPMADYNSIHPPPPTLVPGRNQANQRRLDDLRVLPSHTGGRLVANTNDPDKLLPAVLAESQSYYLLGIEPSAPRDGKFHRIEVRVNRRGVSVHSRNGYVGAPLPAGDTMEGGDARAELEAALNGPLPRQDLPLSINVAAFPSVGARTSAVAVLVGTDARMTGPRRFTAVVGAYDIAGRPVRVHHQTVEIPAASDGSGAVREGLLARLDLAPGQYEIRAAVRDERSGAIGSVFSSTEVREARRDEVALSAILLRGSAPPPMSQNPLQDLVPFVPTVARRFAPAETLSAFVRAQRPDASGPVEVVARAIDARGEVRLERQTTVLREKLAAGENDVLFELPLAGLPPGDYLLRIQASAGPRTAVQELRFAVGGL